MRAAVFGLLLLGCGPVMLGEEASQLRDGTDSEDAGSPNEGDNVGDAAVATLGVSVSVKPVDCGRCFELQAYASGGHSPYEFEWGDGSREGQRRVCVEQGGASLTVVARDQSAARSPAHSIQLEGLADGGCPASMPPSVAPPPARLCLNNPSFEGTPAANFGLPENFDAAPWTSCMNPAVVNTPTIVNDTIPRPEGIVEIPDPTDGETYLALSEDHQVSQKLCSPVGDTTSFSLELDLSRLNLMTVSSTEQIWLEIWSGLAMDCSQRELLGASAPLQVGWQHICVTLRPRSYFDQLTFRAVSDQTTLAPSFLLVDNVKPVDRCP